MEENKKDFEVVAVIGDDSGTWKETITVYGCKTAKEGLNECVEQFNNSLRPGEKPRHIVKILRKRQINQ